MFGWFGSWFRKQHPQREIFRYWDGARWRGADPVAVFRKMAAHEKFDPEKHLEMLASELPALQDEAQPIAVAATREIFDIPPWSETNEQGLTELETLAVLNDFCVFADGLKKNGAGQPT